MSYYKNSYSTGDTFIDYSGNKYTVVTGGNTPSTPFDSNNIVNDLIVWGDLELEPVEEGGTGQGLVDYEANTSYSVGDIVIYDDKIYRCITAHTSTSTFDSTKWEELSSGGGISNWQANTAYNVNDVVIDSNLIWQCATAHTSTTTFDESKWICISGGEISNGMKYDTLWEGEAGNLSGTSTATITLTEPYTKYEKIGITASFIINSYEFVRYFETTRDLITASVNDMYPLGYGSETSYIGTIDVVSPTELSIYCQRVKITKIIGISEGVVIPTGVQAARVTLWEGQYNTVNSSLQISDSIENYDQFEMTFGNDNLDELGTFIWNTSDIIYNRYANFRVFNGHNDAMHYTVALCFIDSTHVKLNTLVATTWSTCYLTKITGIKYIQPDSYSTEEKLIGTWIDGKPLYRKVFTPTGSGTSLTFSSGLTSTNYNVQSIYGYVLDAASNILPVPFNDGTTRFTVYVAYSTGVVHIETNQLNYTVKSVIVEYTKN